ncbi:MAG: hypothetical protein AAGI07_18405, partial [Bacteroidota bacterium]
MKKIGLLLQITFLLCACDPNRKKKVDPEIRKYGTTDSSELFFKNMRQYYYDLENKGEAGLHLFRLKDRVLAQEHPIINLSIIFNWRNDEAYLYMEPNNFFSDTTEFTIIWKDVANQKEGAYHFLKGNRDTYFTFAAQVYNSILAEHNLFYKEDDGLTPLLVSDVERDV